jgi:NitT/TauT family transport system substrate-binding protein
MMADQMQAGFMVAPMAIALRAQGVPVKIVYLGHRYGSALVVGRDAPIRDFGDLRGRTVAIPSRFSNERLVLFRVMKQFGMTQDDFRMVEMAPPDMNAALAAGAIDAYSVGEPFPSQAEISGIGRVLFHHKEVWPDYTSCVLVVRQDVIDRRPDAVQVLVDGIARSGLWLEEGREHRMHAADFVGRYYFHQDPRMLEWALTRPLDRVKYTPLSPYKGDFDLMRDLMLETGTLERSIEFEEYVDTRFAEGAKTQTAWRYEPGSRRAE